MEIAQVLKLILGNHYYTTIDMRYNKKIGILFSKDELLEFLSEKEKLMSDKDTEKCFVKLPLKTFNSKCIFYVDNVYLAQKIHDYISLLVKDKQEKNVLFSHRHMDQMITSRIFSEIEGTLNIENVPTTHKRIKQILGKEDLADKNDIIIKNMFNAIKFIVLEKPAFNKENLFKLYSLLSNNCLDEEDQLKEGAYYRDDAVSIGGYEGVDAALIEEYMNSLFEFANDKKQIKKLDILLPHICHYYLLYLHPYFDYNGRTARMVSFWISIINDLAYVSPLYMSEAINECKKAYYDAIVETRNTRNDLTYFLGYVLDTATKFCLIYKNVEEIKNRLAVSGDFLTDTELLYIKKVLIHNPEGFFNYKMFIGYIGNNITKQAALKTLHHLADYNVLEETKNKKKETIFRIAPQLIVYATQ